MKVNEIVQRIKRIYSAVGVLGDLDLGKYKPTVSVSDRHVAVSWGSLTGNREPELENLAHEVIGLIAHTRDHLKIYCENNGKNPDIVYQAFKASDHLKILIDLANSEKHGYPLKRKTWTGQHPQIVNIRRVMLLSTGSEPNSGVSVRLTPHGFVQDSIGTGYASIAIDADIIDHDETPITTFGSVVPKALDDLDGLIGTLGISL